MNKLPTYQKKRATMTPEQYQDLREKFNPQMVIAFDMLYQTGIRPGELLALTPKDISNRKITISKMLDASGNLRPPKTEHDYRDIMIADDLYEHLSEYAANTSSDERIFQFPQQSLSEELERATKEANLPHFNVHFFRDIFLSKNI